MDAKFTRRIILAIVFALIIYLGLSLYFDIESVVTAFTKFSWIYLPLLLLLAYLNYITRYVKWEYYLRKLNIKITGKESRSIFFSGLAMSATPGKLGELLKSYLLKKISGEPVSKTAPVIFAERLTDLVSLIILAFVGALFYDYSLTFLILAGVFTFAIILLLASPRIVFFILGLLGKIKSIKPHAEKLNQLYLSTQQLIGTKALLLMTFLSIISWYFECLAFYLVLVVFGVDTSIMWCTFVYSFATIAGALSMLPGGLGVTEGSLTIFMINSGVPEDVSVISTFIIRVVTLWFAIILGIISLVMYQRKIGKIDIEQIKKQSE